MYVCRRSPLALQRCAIRLASIPRTKAPRVHQLRRVPVWSEVLTRSSAGLLRERAIPKQIAANPHPTSSETTSTTQTVVTILIRTSGYIRPPAQAPALQQ